MATALLVAAGAAVTTLVEAGRQAVEVAGVEAVVDLVAAAPQEIGNGQEITIHFSPSGREDSTV